jgi:DNA-binding transcriptional LysR family regulator
VFVEELVLVSSRRQRIEEGARPQRLLVFREGCSYRKKLVDLTAPPDGGVLAVVEFGSLEGILGCVAAGMGVTLLPANVVRASSLHKHLRLQPLPGDQGRAETTFIRRGDTPLAPAMARFLECLDHVVTPPDLRSVGTTA